MIIEFVTGAVAQLGRFLGRIPAALGWSGVSAQPAASVRQLTGTWAVPSRTGAWAVPTPKTGTWGV